MSSTPLVSVVIPCFKATQFIAETLNSLRAQTFRDFETILVNDGCPDTENLERVLEPYQDEIVYLKSGRWASISESRNNGILTSQAKYIALLDADDRWEPEYLQTLTGVLESRPDLDLVFPDAIYFGEGAGSWEGLSFMSKNPCADEITMEELVTRRTSIFISIMARREALIRAGLFDPQVPGGEDWDLWMRVRRTGGRIIPVRKPLARYRLRKGSMSADKLDLLRNGLTVCRKHLALPDLPQQERPWFEAKAAEYQAQQNFVMAKQALYAGRGAEAAELFRKANLVLKNPRLNLAIWALKIAPGLLHSYVRNRYPTEYSYLH